MNVLHNKEKAQAEPKTEPKKTAPETTSKQAEKEGEEVKLLERLQETLTVDLVDLIHQLWDMVNFFLPRRKKASAGRSENLSFTFTGSKKRIHWIQI